ncbi:uncharacterized protein LOC110699532 [Chenopodium quinoa]|uniref:uncharacterized protein LOC110699532 n=1 Tax=Chenopodium quinoa TaxID=63459 RepID=UPI000B77A06E|nr:uncharacterized protein LOC110699532 [Chenopodium quinoa]
MGDENTGFFHKSIKMQAYKKRVVSIKDMNGSWCYGRTSIAGAFTDYYKWLLGTKQICSSKMDLVIISQGVKAPGPDGFNISFYKLSWDSSGKLLKEINYTNLVVLPKCDQPESVTDFRPIAYLHADIIGRYKMKSSPQGSMVKVDIQKAHDSANWNFLEYMLTALNFPNHFIKMVMECVRIPSFSLVINGEVK